MDIGLALAGAKKLLSFVQKSNDLELTNIVIDLQAKLLELSAQIAELTDKNAQLQRDLDLKGSLEYRPEWHCYFIGEDGPYCARCWESDRKLIHAPAQNYMSGLQTYCPVCKTMYSAPHTT